MTRLNPLAAATATATADGASRELLGELENRHGQVGQMVSTMAHSPAVLGGCLHLSRVIRRAKLDRRIGERISIAVQTQLGCLMCLQAHIDAARALGVPDFEIDLARKGTSGDAAIAAMVAYGLRAYRAPHGDQRPSRGSAPLRVPRPGDRGRRRDRGPERPDRDLQPHRRPLRASEPDPRPLVDRPGRERSDT